MKIPAYLSEEWFWAMMQFVGVTASLIYLSRQVHIARMSTMLATMDAMTAKLKCDLMQDARRELCDDFVKSNNVKPATMTDSAHLVASWLNEVGVLVEQGVLDADLVWSRYSIYAENYWLLLQDGIIHYRQSVRDKSWFKSMENLYPKMMRINWRLSHEGRLRQRLARLRKTPRLDPSKADANLLTFIAEERSMLRPRPGSSPAPVSVNVPDQQPISEVLRQVAGWLDTR
jgi:hypothetical protein